MKFVIALVSYLESLGYDTSSLRKSADGSKAIVHMQYAEILSKNLDTNANVTIYDRVNPDFQALLASDEWNGNVTGTPNSFGDLAELAKYEARLTTQVTEAKTDMDNFQTEIAGEVTTAKEDLNAIVDSYQVTVNQQLADIENTKANIADLPSSAYTFKGSTTFPALPTTGNVLGDVYYTTDNLQNYAWTGTAWMAIGNGAFANGTVVTQKIADGSVTPPKTNFITRNKVGNLLDQTKLSASGYYINNSGAVVAVAGYQYTDFIYCDKSDIVFLSGTSAGLNTQMGGLYLNGVWVGSIVANATSVTYLTSADSQPYFKVVFKPDAVVFDSVKFNLYNLSGQLYKFVMFNLDDAPSLYINSNYEPFEYSYVLQSDIKIQKSEYAETSNSGKSKIVNCWGDSLTKGAGSTATQYQYPSVLQNLLGINYIVNNLGVGGEGAAAISARQGGRFAFVQPCTIPASGGIAITLKNNYGTDVPLAVQAGSGLNPCYINGIEGTLTYSGGIMTFTRTASGAETVIARPIPLITDGIKNYFGGTMVLWVGTNNRPYFATSNDDYVNEVHNVIKNIQNMVDFANCKDYIVVGMTSLNYMAQVDKVNKEFANVFGSHFLDVRKNILTNGLSEAGITPTTQDTTDIANGEIPTSLRYDVVHLNNAGYNLIAKYVKEHGQTLGYW